MSNMNARERYLAVAHFKKPDKVPISVGDIRKDVLKRWRAEGMPRDVDPWAYFDFDGGSSEGAFALGISISSYTQAGGWGLNPNAINLGPLPPFEQRVLEEDERYRIWIDDLGITQKGFTKDWKEGWSGFATRVFMDFPVRNRKDFLEMKNKYDPKSRGRYPKQWKELRRQWRERSYPIGFSLRGPFWFVRDMMGLHRMMIEFYRNPDFIREIMEFSTEFHIETLRRAAEEVSVDFAWICEDMSYKRGPMISPKMVREFMLPCYKRLSKFCGSTELILLAWTATGTWNLWFRYGLRQA